MTDYTRNIGRIFHSVSVTSAASKCAKAINRMGGSGLVMISPDGDCRVMASGTIDADRALASSASDCAGTYEMDHSREIVAIADLIEADIWNHVGGDQVAA